MPNCVNKLKAAAWANFAPEGTPQELPDLSRTCVLEGSSPLMATNWTVKLPFSQNIKH